MIRKVGQINYSKPESLKCKNKLPAPIISNY